MVYPSEHDRVASWYVARHASAGWWVGGQGWVPRVPGVCTGGGYRGWHQYHRPQCRIRPVWCPGWVPLAGCLWMGVSWLARLGRDLRRNSGDLTNMATLVSILAKLLDLQEIREKCSRGWGFGPCESWKYVKYVSNMCQNTENPRIILIGLRQICQFWPY